MISKELFEYFQRIVFASEVVSFRTSPRGRFGWYLNTQTRPSLAVAAVVLGSSAYICYAQTFSLHAPITGVSGCNFAMPDRLVILIDVRSTHSFKSFFFRFREFNIVTFLGMQSATFWAHQVIQQRILSLLHSKRRSPTRYKTMQLTLKVEMSRVRRFNLILVVNTQAKQMKALEAVILTASMIRRRISLKTTYYKFAHQKCGTNWQWRVLLRTTRNAQTKTSNRRRNDGDEVWTADSHNDRNTHLFEEKPLQINWAWGKRLACVTVTRLGAKSAAKNCMPCTTRKLVNFRTIVASLWQQCKRVCNLSSFDHEQLRNQGCKCHPMLMKLISDERARCVQCN